MPGWDGLLVTAEGNAWAPYGDSAWEFSTEENAGSKATADYKKRTKNPQGIDRLNATFVFVTPRKWNGKKKWAAERSKEGDWSDVRALNSDDLAAWLGQAPAVAHWFARLIGKLPATGFIPLDEWWENWSTIANPHISSELVIAGRQDHVERWLSGYKKREVTTTCRAIRGRKPSLSFQRAPTASPPNGARRSWQELS